MPQLQRFERYRDMAVIIGDHCCKKSSNVSIVRLESVLGILYNTYLEFLKEGILPIEQLNLETRSRYWEQSKKFYKDESSCIKAAKSVYVLELITAQTTPEL